MAQKLWRRGGKWIGTRVGARVGGVWIGGGSGAADTTPPSAVGSLVGTATGTRVTLSWTAATDNVGVVGYRILRDGILVGSSTSPGYSDTTAAPTTSYVYTVRAVDGAGLVGPDTSVPVTTGVESAKLAELAAPMGAANLWTFGPGTAVVDLNAPPLEVLAGPIAGASTTTAVTVSARLPEAAGALLRLADGTASATVVPPAEGWAKVTLGGLPAGFRGVGYWELDGVPDLRNPIVVRTHPAQATTCRIAFGSCDDSAGGASTYDRVLAKRPDLFAILGDIDYDGIAVNSIPAILAARGARLASGTLRRLLAAAQLVYNWSDWDYGGDDSDATTPSRPAAQSTYRTIFPHYPLPSGTGGIYHGYTYGGGASPLVEGLVTDLRSYRDPGVTCMGAEQLAWFLGAITASTAKLIVWHCEMPWVDPGTTGDGWGTFTEEQRTIADHVVASGKRLVIIAGDMHAVAANDGSSSPGGIPVFHAAPFDQDGGVIKGGPYTHGPIPSTATSVSRQYGLLDVAHSGTTLTATFTAYDSNDTVVITVPKTWTGVAA